MPRVDHQPDPEVHLTPVGRRQNRWLAVFALAALAIVALAIAKPWDSPTTVAALPSPAAIAPSAPGTSAPAPTFRTTTLPISTRPMMGGTAWLLDFDRSGLSPFVCLKLEGSRCQSRGRLGSSIEFIDDQILGGTGLGGGCDQFTGTVNLRKQGLGYITIAVPTHESRCYDTGVDRTIRERLNRVASWHFDSELLILLDTDETQLLVYGRVVD
jgi:hypothetical protein